jgi:hypothetical protein
MAKIDFYGFQIRKLKDELARLEDEMNESRGKFREMVFGERYEKVEERNRPDMSGVDPDERVRHLKRLVADMKHGRDFWRENWETVKHGFVTRLGD